MHPLSFSLWSVERRQRTNTLHARPGDIDYDHFARYGGPMPLTLLLVTGFIVAVFAYTFVMFASVCWRARQNRNQTIREHYAAYQPFAAQRGWRYELVRAHPKRSCGGTASCENMPQFAFIPCDPWQST